MYVNRDSILYTKLTRPCTGDTPLYCMGIADDHNVHTHGRNVGEGRWLCPDQRRRVVVTKEQLWQAGKGDFKGLLGAGRARDAIKRHISSPHTAQTESFDRVRAPNALSERVIQCSSSHAQSTVSSIRVDKSGMLHINKMNTHNTREAPVL